MHLTPKCTGNVCSFCCMWNNLLSAWYLWLHTLSEEWESGGFVLQNPHLCRPCGPFPCTFMLPCTRAKFSLTVVATCKVSPCLVSLLSTCFPVFSPPLYFFACSSFWREALNFSSPLLDSPFAQPALFMKSFVSLESIAYFWDFFLNTYLHKELMCCTLCRHTGERLSVYRLDIMFTQSYLVLIKSFWIPSLTYT